jgi:hypothetical protein
LKSGLVRANAGAILYVAGRAADLPSGVSAEIYERIRRVLAFYEASKVDFYEL